MALLSKHNYPFRHKTGYSIRSVNNGGVVMKNKTTFLSEHILGPCFSSVRKKKFQNLFQNSL